jgi:hypothetical protein
MGLLDDLEQQAQKERDSKEEVLKQRRDFFKNTTLPVMENLYDYLTRLSKSLNFLKSPRLGRYPITGYGEVVTRCDTDMNVQAQMPMYGRTYTLTCTGIVDASQSPTMMIEGASRIEAMVELFRRFGFEAMERAEKNEKGDLVKAQFRAWGKVPMTAVFTAEMNSDLLKMEFTNFDAFGTRKQSVRIADINDDLLDSIGKYIALQQNYIMRESISDENREACGLPVAMLFSPAPLRWRGARDIRRCRRPVRVRTPPRDAECRSVRCRRTSRPGAGRGRRARSRCRAAFSSSYSALRGFGDVGVVLRIDHADRDLPRRHRLRPDHAVVVEVLFDRGGDDAAHADAVAAHRRQSRPCRWRRARSCAIARNISGRAANTWPTSMPRAMRSVPWPSGDGSPATTLRMSATKFRFGQIAAPVHAGRWKPRFVGADDEIGIAATRAVGDHADRLLRRDRAEETRLAAEVVEDLGFGRER